MAQRQIGTAQSWAMRGFGLVMALFIALGTYYAVAAPIFEKPDEPQHFFFVRELVERRGLPVQIDGQASRWGQEGSQPPLYYMLTAALTFWTDAGDWEQASRPNPYAVQGDPQALGNRNVFLHGAWDAFPWQGITLSIQLARLVSLLCGAASLLVTYRLALCAFPGRTDIALGASAFQALLPQFLFVAGAVSNDALAALTCGLALWQAARVARGARGLRDDILLGVFVGLAALSKLSGATFAAFAVIALLLAEKRRPLPALQRIAIVGATAALVAGWWYARNFALYGDLTGLNRMLAIVGTRDPAPDLWQLLDETEGLRLSFWGLFGWFSILMPRAVYYLYDLLALLALAGGVLALMRLRARPISAAATGPVLLLALALLAMLVSVLRWGSLTPGLQGRLLFPALPAIAVLWSAGVHALFPLRPRRAALATAAGAMVLVAALAPPLVIAPAYRVPEQPARIAAEPLMRWGERINLLAIEPVLSAAHPGDEVDLTLTWQIDQPLDRPYTLYIKLFGEGGELSAGTDTYPGYGMLPTTQWTPARRIVDRYRLRIFPAARTPVLAEVVLGWYDAAVGAPLPPSTAAGQRVVRPVLARVKLTSSAAPFVLPAVAQQADFGGRIRLHGYDLTPSGITLYWSALHPLPDDYVVFVHALDRAGQIVAQHDGQPRAGLFPTAQWDQGVMVSDAHPLAFPPDVVWLRLGLYGLKDKLRLPVAGTTSDYLTIPYPR